MSEDLHRCNLPEMKERTGYGAAVTYCQEYPDGTLDVSNDEYGSRVNYCPVCGFKAKKQIAPEDRRW